MKKLLNEKIEQLNFSDALNKRIKDINLFIETTTKNNIRNFLQPHEITQDTVLTIVNAVYFNGKWVCSIVILSEKKMHFIQIVLISRHQEILVEYFIRMELNQLRLI